MDYSDQERRILRALQKDAAASMADLAEAVGLGVSTVWRRVQELQKCGVIRARVALLEPKKLDLGLCVFAQVALTDHAPDSIEAFASMIESEPQILEAHSLSGADDYLLKIRCKDVEAYEEFLSKRLLRQPMVRSVTSTFSLRTMKDTIELPI